MTASPALVLVVEDEPLISLEIQDVLQTAGHRILGPVRSCRDTLSLLARQRPDVAVLDHMLLDGESKPVLERLGILRVPVIMLSGYPADQADAVVSSWIEKPFLPSDLIDALTRVWPAVTVGDR